MKKDGVKDSDYIEEQMRKANHWATIGIGKKDIIVNGLKSIV